MNTDIMISVIIPVYNRENTIETAIKSVIDQTYTKWELIIVNDCSNDHTAEVIEKYIKYDSRIRTLVNKKNMGVSCSRNNGIIAAQGKYIAFLDSDDEWLKEHLEECISVLETNERTFCSALWIEEKYGKENKVGTDGWYKYIFEKAGSEFGFNIKDKYWMFDSRLFQFILETDFYCFHINTVVVRKDYLIEIGLFDTKMYGSEDMDLVYRLIQKNNLITVNNYHFVYHYGNDNLYAYFDRNTTELENIINNKASVVKLYKNLTSKVYMLKKTKKLIKNNPHIEDKELYISKVNEYIYNRLMSCAYVCKNKMQLKSIILYLKALRFSKYKKEGDSLLRPFSEYRKERLYID